MSKGEGLVGLLYALKDLVETFAIMIITGIAVIAFFWLIVNFLAAKAGFGGKVGLAGKAKINPKSMIYAIFILFVILCVYALISLTASLFGVNSSPSGGLLVD